jgi:phosphatidylglycerophosphate synthase
VTPNQLTLASLAVGLLAVWALGRGEPWPGAVGLLLYALSVVLDHADGEVARLTLAESTVGEWLDVVSDTVIHALLVVAMGVATERLVGGGGVVLGVAGAAGVVAGAALAKAWPPEAETDGLGAMFQCLSNRNGFYVLLLLFIAALAVLPAALPVVMLVAAAGMHAYWLGRVLHRLAHPGSGRAHGEGELGLDDVAVDGQDAEPDDVGARRERR